MKTKRREYVYSVWQYKVLSKNKSFESKKKIERQNNKQNVGNVQNIIEG